MAGWVQQANRPYHSAEFMFVHIVSAYVKMRGTPDFFRNGVKLCMRPTHSCWPKMTYDLLNLFYLEDLTFGFVSIGVSISPLLLFTLTLLLPRYIRIEHHNQRQSVLYWFLLHHILQALLLSSSLQVNPSDSTTSAVADTESKTPMALANLISMGIWLLPLSKVPPSEIRVNQ